MPSIVIDTNVWYSAVVYGELPESVIFYCLDACKIVLSEDIVHELLDRLKVKAKAPYRWLRILRLHLDRLTVIVPAGESITQEVRDPKDVHVMAVAHAEKCDYVITGDKDLLELGSYQQIQIVSSRQFLEEVLPLRSLS